jgi:hypothetical protein
MHTVIALCRDAAYQEAMFGLGLTATNSGWLRSVGSTRIVSRQSTNQRGAHQFLSPSNSIVEGHQYKPYKRSIDKDNKGEAEDDGEAESRLRL